jgi:MtrB/PioB family decaheme-associated outer membrane protein
MVGGLLTVGMLPTHALAQQGCCEGGSATGANAWTNGLATSDQWPVDPGAASNPFSMPLKAPPAVPTWWLHGQIEAGGRGFLNDPLGNGSIFGNTPGGGYVFLGQNSLAKYYEYSRVAPGVFGGAHVAAGRIDGLYQADLWANNIGYQDQAYLLELSKIGEQYLSLQWDQSPHLYSTSAQTPYLGIGTSTLVLPPGFASNTNTPASIIPFLHLTDVGINRNTGSVDYRWTPTEAWDIRAAYAHLERTGTLPAGVTGLPPNGGSAFNSPTEVTAPVDDTTQNFGVNGEYAGTSPWGQRYTFKVAYNGSLYTDNISSYTVQNPYCSGTTSASCAGSGMSPFARISTPPSNSAHGVGGTFSADLPLRSRYVSTVDYTMMRQDAAFQPMTDNPNAVASPFGGGAPWNSLAALPALNLDGQINTLLSNNVFTTQITPELSSKLTYRYYNSDNETPLIVFPSWVPYDRTGSSTNETISSLSISYIKQNAGAQLNWRPTREWNFNAGYGYERYDYTQADVNVTNENSGKLSADWKPTIWFTARTSGYFAVRQYDTYDYTNFVKSIQFPTVPGFPPQTDDGWFYSPAYRQFMFDNRERTKADFAIDLVAFHGVTISPSLKYQDDNYGLNPLNQEGISDSRSVGAGVDVGFVVNRDLSFTVSYYWEYYNQSLYNWTNNAGNSASPGAPNFLISTFDKERVNTFTAVMNYAAIPDKLDFDLRYTISDGVDEQVLVTAAPSSACGNCQGQFPNNTTLFERFDATATYKFAPVMVSQMGFKGNVKAKLRYTWERNSVSNWQNDPLAPFTNIPGLTNGIWLASENPNYNVHMIAASLITTW